MPNENLIIVISAILIAFLIILSIILVFLHKSNATKRRRAKTHKSKAKNKSEQIERIPLKQAANIKRKAIALATKHPKITAKIISSWINEDK